MKSLFDISGHSRLFWEPKSISADWGEKPQQKGLSSPVPQTCLPTESPCQSFQAGEVNL